MSEKIGLARAEIVDLLSLILRTHSRDELFSLFRSAEGITPKEDPEAWREECRKKQAAGVRFAVKTISGEWVLNHKQVSSISDNHVVGVDFNFEGNKEDYREVPQEVSGVKPMKLTAKIIRRGVYKTSYYWEFFGTREEYRAECEKYGYAILSEIKEVVEKPKTVKYYFAMLNRYRCTPFGRAASDKDQIIEYAKKHCYTIIGDIEEREIEA